MKPKRKSKKAPTQRSYSDRTLKILWGRAAGRCALPDCRIDVLVDATEHDPIVVVGDIAHIEGAAQGAARHNAALSRRDRDDYENLILLCKVCHTKLDGQRRTNTVAKIKALRQAHEAWVRENLPEHGRNRVGWKVLVLQGAHQIEVPAAYASLAPDHEDGEASVLTVKPDSSWTENIATITEGARRVLAANDDAFTTRIAVFPLAPVSACIGLGYLLTNRPWTRAYQFHRDDRSWAWRPYLLDAVMPAVLSWPESKKGAEGDVAVCFDLSARIPDTSLRGPTGGFAGVVRLGVPAPSTGWLQTEAQLTGLGVLARESFERLAAEFPAASRWHVFYAGPAPGAVVVGQQLNPTMTPPVQLYEFQRGAVPEHSPSVVLKAGRLQSAAVSVAATPPAAEATSAPAPAPRTGR